MSPEVKNSVNEGRKKRVEKNTGQSLIHTIEISSYMASISKTSPKSQKFLRCFNNDYMTF